MKKRKEEVPPKTFKRFSKNPAEVFLIPLISNAALRRGKGLSIFVFLLSWAFLFLIFGYRSVYLKMILFFFETIEKLVFWSSFR